MIYPITGWSDITHYNDNKVMTIAKLVETTWLVRYPRPVEITYNQGNEFLGHGFKNSLMEQEYDIKTNPDSSGNPQSNETVEIIHKLLGNLICTYNLNDKYVDDAEPCTGIPGTAVFAVQSTYNQTKQKHPGQLVFGQDMIPPINHLANWRFIHQRKQT